MAAPNIALNAVTSSVRQIYSLLRSIQFTTKVQLSIAEGGIHFSSEDARVMQASVMIEKGLFSSYVFTAPQTHEINSSQSSSENSIETYDFQINLPAMLEMLQILGLSESNAFQSNRDNSGISAMIARGGPANALSNRVLATPAVCRLTYPGNGGPLKVILEESSLTTTCSLTTYEPEMDADTDIPLQRERLILKLIMRASLLLGAITELDSISPAKLNLTVSPRDPNLTLSAVGPHSSASVEFSRDKQLLETFTCGNPSSNSYKFHMVKAATRAMALASKVSIRIDESGVLSLQFMVEGDGPGNTSFVDFRYVALIDNEEETDE